MYFSADDSGSFEYGAGCGESGLGLDVRGDECGDAAWLAAAPEGGDAPIGVPDFEASGALLAAAAVADDGAFGPDALFDPSGYPTLAQQFVASAAWPWSAVVQVTAKFPNGVVYLGSGVMVGRNDVLTAAHVVYNRAWGGAAVDVEVTPAVSTLGPPFRGPYGRHDAQITYVDTRVDPQVGPDGNFFAVPGDRGPGYAGSERDMAFLSLWTAVGDRTGWMSLDPTFKGGYANLSGYAYKDNGRLTNDVALAGDDRVDAFTYIGNFQVFQGQSGGPLWHYGSGGRPAVVGIASTAGAAYDVATNYASILGLIASNDAMIIA